MYRHNKNLNKEITLEKDIAPIDKKVVKKNELPKVKKAVPTGTKNALGYSAVIERALYGESKFLAKTNPSISPSPMAISL